MKRDVIVVANLKPSNLKGIKSFGMVLCGGNADRTVVEFVDPPTGSVVGERISVEGFAGDADAVVDAKKKKNNVWTAVAPDLAVDAEGRATYKGAQLTTSAGVCTCKTLKSCPIS